MIVEESKRRCLGAFVLASSLLVFLALLVASDISLATDDHQDESARESQQNHRIIDQSNRLPDTSHDPNPTHPFGRPHESAPPELAEFAFLVGVYECRERLRLETGDWLKFRAIWRGRYVLGGFAIQDDYFTASVFATNLRIFDPGQKKWIVSFSRMPGFAASEWRGEQRREPDKTMVMTRVGSATAGPTFSQITQDAFEWNSGGLDPNWFSSCRRSPNPKAWFNPAEAPTESHISR